MDQHDRHLDDIQMAAVLAGDTDSEAERHVAACATCAAERARLLAAIGDWRADVQLASERPAAFWERQRRAIAERRAAEEAAQRFGVLGGVLGVTHRGAGESQSGDARPSHRGSTTRKATAGGSRPSQRWSTARWAIAGAAAAAIVAVVLALGIALRPEPAKTVIASATPAPSGISPARAGAAAPQGSAADDALLLAVEGALARRAPAALEPAEALLIELDRARRDGGES